MKYVLIGILLFNTSVFGMEDSHAEETSSTEQQRYNALFEKYKTELQTALSANNGGSAKHFLWDTDFHEIRSRYQKELAAQNFRGAMKKLTLLLKI